MFRGGGGQERGPREGQRFAVASAPHTYRICDAIGPEQLGFVEDLGVLEIAGCRPARNIGFVEFLEDEASDGGGGGNAVQSRAAQNSSSVAVVVHALVLRNHEGHIFLVGHVDLVEPREFPDRRGHAGGRIEGRVYFRQRLRGGSAAAQTKRREEIDRRFARIEIGEDVLHRGPLRVDRSGEIRVEHVRAEFSSDEMFQIHALRIESVPSRFRHHARGRVHDTDFVQSL